MVNSYLVKCFNPNGISVEEVRQNVSPSLHWVDDLCCKEECVCEILSSLDTSKSNGPDGISANILKFTALSIAPSITKIFNLTIKTGKQREIWKLSYIVPILKSSKAENPCNYRPISFLCVLSKVLDKHVYALIFAHLDIHYPLSDSQWGFRP